MARATVLETAKRIDLLQVMILEGEPNTVCLASSIPYRWLVTKRSIGQ